MTNHRRATIDLIPIVPLPMLRLRCWLKKSVYRDEPFTCSRHLIFAATGWIINRTDQTLAPGDMDMETVTAIYENGVFRPIGEVQLPEGTRVVVETEEAAAERIRSARRRVFESLSRSYDTGEKVEPVAVVTRTPRTSWPSQPGTAKDRSVWMAPDFDAPLEDFAEYME